MRNLPMWSLTAMLCLAGSQVLGEDVKDSQARWPQFRGPGAQGIGRDGLRLPAQFGTSKNVVWKIALPPGHSSPCVWDDHIYVTGFAKKARKLETICLDRARGKVLWRQTAAMGKIQNVHPLNTPAPSTPASDGQQDYASFASSGFTVY